MELIEKIVSTLSGIVWGAPMLVLLVGTGIYLTVILKGMQFWALPHAMKLIFHKEEDGAGEISHFAALMTALAATVGIGNIVGVATAITLGGPGAVFWMWMTGLVGMATKYSEAVLAVKYRQHSHHHGFKGGPMYYLTYGLNMPKLGLAFALFTALAAFGIGNMTQANAVATILETQMSVPTWVTGVVLLTLTAVVILGGIKSIGRFTSFLVPFMILVYVAVSLVILCMNLDKLPHALSLIFYHAFNPIAAGGGFVGATMAAAIRYGVARGVFSNESGLGSAPIAAAAAKTNDPVRQALVSMTQTFIDTLVVCSMTALIILISPFWQEGVSPGLLTMKSFELYLGSFGTIVVVVSTVLFAYSTILGWSYYGEKAFEYLLGERFIRLYRVLFIAGVMVGSMMKLEFVWNFSDLMNGMMAIPNLIALLLLSKVIASESKRYFESLK
ncbi:MULTISPECIES: sodium:alanine symporter family protein [Sulfurospirillum]|jgi:AGCS family alanine or glycine:cation symporter|uniref:Sodium:alanine symporter family protein n=1 Tax=Sulfurospirillum cavolei TaxID=366522 RepID=A0A2D3W9P1_9BACT|nr:MULTISPECIES: sodium:alanine symporter family protein [Sulfurospirillum]KHG33088.1 MAG: transporter [Sulfurospirillum sp. MES]MCP3653029.1 sodium:alanine symporter family protein [Sulfurospirillum sp. DNRA8]MCR1811880.1 sodium:alanine symporter family protein [Sulfurospirillum sp. DNRA8]DAB35810.1 MAG TPA: sodium:alanine symporter family protein [Sulfurospirillum cavolei]